MSPKISFLFGDPFQKAAFYLMVICPNIKATIEVALFYLKAFQRTEAP